MTRLGMRSWNDEEPRGEEPPTPPARLSGQELVKTWSAGGSAAAARRGVMRNVKEWWKMFGGSSFLKFLLQRLNPVQVFKASELNLQKDYGNTEFLGKQRM